MRAPLLLPLSITLLSAFPALAQDAPRVLFCSGPCFAVDANGARTPAPKGTTLRADQRFETGAGAYAQIKLGPDAAMALGDGARVRFDQKNFRDRLVVFLDLGRVRMIGGEAIGKPVTRPVELHTADGAFALRNADIVVAKTQVAAAGNVTTAYLNAGDARLGETPIQKGDFRGFAGGKPISQPIARTEIPLIPPPTRAVTPHAQPVTPILLPDVAVTRPLRGVELPVAPAIKPLPPTVLAPLPGTIPDASLKPVAPIGDLLPRLPVITPTGELMTLTSYVLTDPVLTTSTTTKSLELIDTSTTLSTSSLSSISLTTTSTTLTDTTVTKYTTSPTTLTTTTTTTSTLSTSPLTTTTIQPITISPTLLIR